MAKPPSESFGLKIASTKQAAAQDAAATSGWPAFATEDHRRSDYPRGSDPRLRRI
jgi:hypothetical protein